MISFYKISFRNSIKSNATGIHKHIYKIVLLRTGSTKNWRCFVDVWQKISNTENISPETTTTCSTSDSRTSGAVTAARWCTAFVPDSTYAQSKGTFFISLLFNVKYLLSNFLYLSIEFLYEKTILENLPQLVISRCRS